MILFLIVAAVLIAGIVIAAKTYSEEAIPIVIFGGFVCLVLIIIIICQNVNPDGRLQAELQKRETLVYQLENLTYLNDNNLGTTELFDQIAEFNGRIYKHREGRKNPLINWYYLPYMDKIEPIEIGRVKE